MNEKRNDNYYETTEESMKNINKFIEDLVKLNVRFEYYLNLYFNFLHKYQILFKFNYHCRVLL